MSSHDPALIFLMSRARVCLDLDAPCPRCGAPRSNPCRRPNGAYMPKVHAERGNSK